jgi:flagellar hook-associated protein 2
MGLASGMDTDFIIQQTLRMHQFKIDNTLRNRRLIEWRQQTHNSIRDEITSLRQTFLSNLGSKSMMNRNAFNANLATASGINSDAVSLRALAGGQLSTFRIGGISQLASGARAVSDQTHLGIQGTARLDSLAGLGFSTNAADREAELRIGNQTARFTQADVNAINWDNETAFSKISLNGTEITLSRVLDGDDEIDNDVLKFEMGSGNSRVFGTITFSPAGVATVNIDGDVADDGNTMENLMLANQLKDLLTRVDNGDDSFTFKNGLSDIEFIKEHKFTSPNGVDVTLTQRANGAVQHNGAAIDYFSRQSIDINGTKIELRSDMTINQMVSTVNNARTAGNQPLGVRMSFEPLTGRFTLESTTTGSASKLDLRENSAFFNALGITNATTIFEGTSAKVFINGDEITSESNTFTFSGVSITLNRTTDGGTGLVTDNNPGNITVNVTRDTSNAIARIREFIDSYNAIISRLEGLLNERKTGREVSYRPLTDEEKLGMSDKQIEEWETIARKGILRNDHGIERLASSLRMSFFEAIEGVGLSPSQIGLNTGNFFDGTGGQIFIDEERLRAALEADPDRVADIFIRIDTSGDGPRGVGLLHKIDDLMRNFVNTTQSTSIRNLEDSLRRANEQIERMEARMWAEEDKLYRQFAAMETAMSRLQQQGEWFGAMLGAGR